VTAPRGIPGDLDPEGLLPRFVAANRWLGHRLEVRGETGSTMDDARRAAEAGAPAGCLCVADAQRQGRGARGRSWSSPGATDLYLSFVLRPAPATWPRLPLTALAAGLGVADAVDQLLGGRRSSVRWPNDVLVTAPGLPAPGGKCAGVLVESVSTGGRVDAVVVGVGLDLNRTAFPGELEGVATSLRLARAARAGAASGGDRGLPSPQAPPFPRGDALLVLTQALEGRLDQLFPGADGTGDPETAGVDALLADLAPRLAYRGQRVAVEAGTRGTLMGLDPDGALRLRADPPGEGMVRVTAGRVRPLPG